MRQYSVLIFFVQILSLGIEHLSAENQFQQQQQQPQQHASGAHMMEAPPGYMKQVPYNEGGGGGGGGGNNSSGEKQKRSKSPTKFLSNKFKETKSKIGNTMNHIPVVRSLSNSNLPVLGKLGGQQLPKLSSNCDGIYDEIRNHGYEVIEHKVYTKDNYELKLHQIVFKGARADPHPEAKKKPYLLLHGLIGSSASFIRNVNPNYKAPLKEFDNWSPIIDSLKSQHKEFKFEWRSTADQFKASYEGDTSTHIESMSVTQKVLKIGPEKIFATNNELDYDADPMNFGPEFKQAYRKFELPRDSKEYISNSLAYTLANFGYDVWLINLRGNHYSHTYNGRYTSKDAEFWNFNINTLINEDLLASIEYVRKKTKWDKQMGLIAYSYTNLHVLGLLRAHPTYLDSLQPVVMMAPATLTKNWHSYQLGLALKLISKLIAHNGPFPALGRANGLERLVCHSVPVAKKLCGTFETLLNGRASGVKDFIVDDKQGEMVSKDVKCGQTSSAVIHQVIKNLEQGNILPEFQPFLGLRTRSMKSKERLFFRRSIMLIHSEADEISSIRDVSLIRDTAIKMLALTDITIKEPGFGHTDFLFSKRNQYLVNGEIARWVSVFDYMLFRKSANLKTLEEAHKNLLN